MKKLSAGHASQEESVMMAERKQNTRLAERLFARSDHDQWLHRFRDPIRAPSLRIGKPRPFTHCAVVDIANEKTKGRKLWRWRTLAQIFTVSSFSLPLTSTYLDSGQLSVLNGLSVNSSIYTVHYRYEYYDELVWESCSLPPSTLS